METDLPVVISEPVPSLGGAAAQTLVEPPGLGGRVDGDGLAHPGAGDGAAGQPSLSCSSPRYSVR